MSTLEPVHPLERSESDQTDTQPSEGGYQEAGEQNQQLRELCAQVGELADLLEDDSGRKEISILLDLLANNDFHVMVVGDFNRGKSTFINSLLGQVVLPVKATPATAVITEVHYGTEPSARLVRRDGQADEEFTDMDMLAQRILVDRDNPSGKNPYTQALITWPLELARNRVVLVDSPGLDDDVSRDEITLDYLGKADAVIFLQHSIAPMSAHESHFLQTHLCSHEPFFVFTYVDAVDDSEVDDVKANAVERIRALRAASEDRRFYFVNARQGMKARAVGDEAGFVDSGMAQIEQELELYLANDRHRAKVRPPARAVAAVIGRLIRRLPEQVHMLEMRDEERDRAWEEAQEPLRRLRQDAATIQADLNNQHRLLQGRIERQLTTFLGTLAAQASELTEKAAPDVKLSRVPWHIKERTEQAAKEIAAGATREIETRITQWAVAELEPMLTSELEEIARRTDARLDNFTTDLSQLRIKLSGLPEAAAAGSSQESSGLERFVSGGLGLATGGIGGGIVSARFGVQETLRTAMPNIVMGYLLWLIPGMAPLKIAALVIRTVYQFNTGNDRMMSRVREAIGRELGTHLQEAAPGFAREAAEKFVAQHLQQIETTVGGRLTDQLNQVGQDVEAARAVRAQGEAEVALRRAQLADAAKRLQAAAAAASDLLDDLDAR